MSELIVIENGLWKTDSENFIFNNDILTSEHKGVTKGYVERIVDMSDEISRFRRLEQERQRDSFEAALQHLGNNVLFNESEEDRLVTPIVLETSDIGENYFRDMWIQGESQNNRMFPVENLRDSLQRELQTGRIGMLEYLDKISEE